MNHSQRTVLLWSLLATPACGLVVGFEPRELCDDCTSATVTSAHGGATAAGAMGAADTTAGGGSEATSDGGGGPASAAGGSGPGPEGSASATTSGGGATTSSGGSDSSTVGDGGATTTSASSGGSSGGGGETASTLSGGGATTATGGAGSGGSGGDGGAGAGSSGGGNGGTATTTGASGSTTMGGSGGSGGSGGNPSLCDIDDTFDATDNTGAYPAAVVLHRNNSSRPWDFSWVESDDVYVSARLSETDVVLAPRLVDGSGAHSASVVASHGSYAYVAFGEFAGGDARIVMTRLNPLDPAMVDRDDTGALGGDSAPRVVAVALRGSTNDALVAAIDADDSAVLALFGDGQHLATQTVPGPIDDLTALDSGTSFVIAYVQDGALLTARVPYDLAEVEPAQNIPGASPITPGLGSLAGATTSDGAALVWIQQYGVYLTTLDEDGAASESRIQIAPGANVLPKLDSWGDQLFISWVDAASDTLYLQGFRDGSPNDENPLLVSTGVTDVQYGFAADTFSDEPTLGLVYSTDRLRMTIVNCPK